MERKSCRFHRTYIRLSCAMKHWAPETAQILRGGLLITLLVEVCSLVLWYAVTPARAETYELAHSALAMKALVPITLATTLIGAALVERASRRGKA